MSDKPTKLTSLKPKNIIQRWLSEQPEEIKLEFKSYAVRCRNADMIKSFLDTRGCTGNGGNPISLATVYNWMNEFLPKGKEATLVEIDAVEFAGIDTLPLSEKQVAKLSHILDIYNDIVLNAADNGQLESHLGDILKGLPALNSQYRGALVDLAKMRNASDAQMLMRAGASRVVQLIMNAPSVRNTANERWVQTTCNAALEQLVDEVRQTA
jgi:hypothetical protein